MLRHAARCRTAVHNVEALYPVSHSACLLHSSAGDSKEPEAKQDATRPDLSPLTHAASEKRRVLFPLHLIGGTKIGSKITEILCCLIIILLIYFNVFFYNRCDTILLGNIF